MYRAYKIILQLKAQNQQELQVESYHFLGKAALKGQKKAIQRLETVAYEGNNQIEAIIQFYKGMLLELKAKEFYRRAITNQYHAHPFGIQPTQLFEMTKKELPIPNESNEQISEEEPPKKKFKINNPPFNISKESEFLQKEVKSNYIEGLTHWYNYDAKSKKLTDLDSAILSFSLGWNKDESYESLNMWGVALLEDQNERIRQAGLEHRKKAAEKLPFLWIPIGKIYEEGIKVPKDENMACECYQKGLESGYVLQPATPLFNKVFEMRKKEAPN